MIDDNKAIAVMMWMWVSAEVKEDCLKNDRDALISELASKGDAIYCTAFTSIRPGKLLPLFKFFSKMYYDSDILFKKHFKRGKRESIPIMLVRRQRRVKAVSNRR